MDTFFYPKEQKIVVSTNTHFLEKYYISNHKSRVNIILEELQGGRGQLEQPAVQDSTPRVTAQSVNTAPDIVRRSGRVMFTPNRYMFTRETSYHLSADEQDIVDPWTYTKAVGDVDADSWQVAIDSEFESITDMDVYQITELLEGCKAIGSKWVYKRKRGPNGEIVAFKARLVVKGFTQKEGIDYEDTPSSL